MRNGIDILWTGEETGSDVEHATHPKAHDRAVMVIHSFQQYFDVDYGPNGTYDLAFTMRAEAPETHNFSSKHIEHAYTYANILQAVWGPVKERLLQDFRRKRPLHPLWR